ncbi:hypothetical protein BAN20980_01240 [Burkholderia anthina]|uniref:Uncharacterized protein n=1 Tax=Burkholderia anthina TaxID=179879 RepID=A0A6P2G601_9BURK|nr:hypothetical protein BAN20980_01240 [Burkholderia anthina]
MPPSPGRPSIASDDRRSEPLVIRRHDIAVVALSRLEKPVTSLRKEMITVWRWTHSQDANISAVFTQKLQRALMSKFGRARIIRFAFPAVKAMIRTCVGMHLSIASCKTLSQRIGK